MVDIKSPTYPYSRVMSGYAQFRGMERIPYQIINYLMDMPDKNGYQPIDDNKRPRTRLAKYLWYDGANPLSNPLPTPAEKLSMLYDGEEPVLNSDEQKERHPKGYRLYPVAYWGQSELLAQTTLKVYLGRIIPIDNLSARIGLIFEIICNTNQDTTTRTDAYSRCVDIEQCILEALHGVNITGIGVVNFARMNHANNGSRPFHGEGTVVARELHMSIDWMESASDPVPDYCGC